MAHVLNDITFGQYYPAKSPVHKLDPRAKILFTLTYIILTFVARNALSLLLAAAGLVVFLFTTRIPVKMYLKTMKPILPIIIITSLINALYVSGGKELFHWKFITITSNGVLTAVYMSLRICLLILASSMLTYTTTPTDLTDAMERLLSPFKLLKLDVHTLAMMMTIALRFIPTLIEETEKIMSAQKARGADMESGGLMSRIRALIPILIPLLISSFRRASELADAMECRCYHGGDGRTRMKQLRFSLVDFLGFFLFALLLTGVIVANLSGNGVVFKLLTGGLL